MRKTVIATVVAAFAAPALSAGNIDQAGLENIAVIEQQDVDENSDVNVTQTGSSNTAYTTQVGGYDLEATVVQAGELNTAVVTQNGESVSGSVNQQGTSNNATVEQLGGNMSSTIVYQEGQANDIRVAQSNNFPSLIDLRQIGADNYAEVSQTGMNDFGFSSVTILTEGDSNQSVIEQTSVFQRVNLTQTGSSNFVDTRQEGDSVINITSLNSHGNSDVVSITSYWMRATVERSNTDNSSSHLTVEDGWGDIFVEQHNSLAVAADVFQNISWFEDASAEVSQRDAQNVLASISQDWIEGSAMIKQSDGLTASTASVRQHDGLGLIASIYQSSSLGAYAEIDQSGELNTATIEQAGVTNTEASIAQMGASGYAEIVQTGLSGGVSNTAAIVQGGVEYSASIHQDGVSNSALITQL